MNFKEILAKDLTNTFLNINEFGEIRLIDGKELIVIMDDDLLQKRKSLANNPTDGVYNASLVFHVSKSSLSKKPVIKADMKVDARLYTITDVQENESMYTVTLKRSGS
jgi:nitrate reductase NapAB chaperone NapD